MHATAEEFEQAAKILGVFETRGRPRVGLVRVYGESRLTPRPHGRAGADEVRSRGKVALYPVSATSPRLGSLRRETFVRENPGFLGFATAIKMNLQRQLASERERRIDLGVYWALTLEGPCLVKRARGCWRRRLNFAPGPCERARVRVRAACVGASARALRMTY